MHRILEKLVIEQAVTTDQVKVILAVNKDTTVTRRHIAVGLLK